MIQPSLVTALTVLSNTVLPATGAPPAGAAPDCPLGPAPLEQLSMRGPHPGLVATSRRADDFAVAVWPDGGAAQAYIGSSGNTYKFAVTNVGLCPDGYGIVITKTGAVTAATADKAGLSLEPGQTDTVTVTYTVGIVPTGSIVLTATGSFASSDQGSVTVTLIPPPGAPIIDASPYNVNRDYTRCASSCFAAMHAQSTVPYFSLDTPRNVTLIYNSDRVKPKPFIHLNVTPDVSYGQTPTEYQLRLKKNNAPVTFVNGDSVLKFAYGGTAPIRIGGQFDASGDTTGMYTLEIRLRAVYSSPPAVVENALQTKLILVNSKPKPLGRGWEMAGIQRLYTHGDSALVVDGDGSAVYFERAPDLSYITPAGEFSKLVTVGGGGWSRRYPDSTKIAFNSSGRMTEIRDRFNNITSITYDGSNRVWKITDPQNSIITLTYDANGLDAITDPMSRVTQVTVNSDTALTLIQDPDVVGTTFAYDASKRLSTITNRRGHTTTLGYDTESGKLATITSPSVTIVGSTGADTTGSLITTQMPWQKRGVPYSGTTGTPFTAPRADTVYARLTDPGGHVARFSANRWGTPARTIGALSDTTTVVFDANGLSRKVTYPTGVADSMAYNTDGLLTYIRPAGRDSATRIRYAAWGQADSVWGYQQQSVRHFIGTNGRIDSTRVAGGTADSAKTKYVYESRGRVERVTDPEGHLVQRTWYLGTNGNRSRDSIPGDRVTTYSYDSYGRVTSQATPGFATRGQSYDVLNRIKRDSLVGLPATLYSYDSLFLRSVTDAKGQVYAFTYNALGWITARKDPVNRADTLRYDRDGLLRRSKNRRGQTIEFGYDAGHRPTIKFGANTDTARWAYSADWRVVTATSPWTIDSQFSSTAGRIDSVRTRFVWADTTFAQRFRYTQAGAVDSVEVTGGGITFLARKYSWNTQKGSLSSIRLGGAPPTTQASNRDGQLVATTLPGSDQISRAYSSVHAEAQISTGASYAADVNRYASFDAGNRITRQVDGDAGHEYFYDNFGRLRADSLISFGGGNPCEGNPPPIIDENGNTCTGGSWTRLSGQQFSYDSVGNRRDQGGDYGPGNRIRQFASCTYVTDSLGDGSVLSRTCGSETIHFHWSAESRLVALQVVGGDSLDFRYDAAGRLVRRDLNGAAQANFLWQGENLLAELSAAGTAKIAEYSYYPGLDRPHALIVGTMPYFAHRDGIENVVALTDSTKVMQRSYMYDAWGTLTGGADIKPFANADRARFKGALWAGSQVDLYFMRARWYEPKAGRFLSEDPIGLDGGINQFAFAGGDPVNQRDPSGLDPWCLPGEESELTTNERGIYEVACRPGGGGGFPSRDGAWRAMFGMPNALPRGWFQPIGRASAVVPWVVRLPPNEALRGCEGPQGSWVQVTGVKVRVRDERGVFTWGTADFDLYADDWQIEYSRRNYHGRGWATLIDGRIIEGTLESGPFPLLNHGVRCSDGSAGFTLTPIY